MTLLAFGGLVQGDVLTSLQQYFPSDPLILSVRILVCMAVTVTVRIADRQRRAEWWCGVVTACYRADSPDQLPCTRKPHQLVLPQDRTPVLVASAHTPRLRCD